MTTTTLKTGFRIGEIFYPTVELRELTTADLLDAEDDAPADKPLQYSAALLRRQIVRVASTDGREFKGPFALSMIRNLPTGDFASLRLAQREVAEAGEPPSATGTESGAASS